MDWWKNISILRKLRDVSQEELASAIGVGRTTITNYESGKSEPNLKKIIDMSKKLDVSIEDLLLKDLSKQDVQSFEQTPSKKKRYKTNDAVITANEPVEEYQSKGILEVLGRISKLEKDMADIKRLLGNK
jgi:transcriptional regulator with XRE-family HTH domain